jgi:hypothetical protein
VTGGEFVLFVEDSDDLRAMFTELVDVGLKRRCIGVASYEELVALGEHALGCGVAMLDIHLGPSRRSGVDAYAWLREKAIRDGSGVGVPPFASAPAIFCSTPS